MKLSENLAYLDIAIANRDPRLAKQLRPGFSSKELIRRLKKVPGDNGPLYDIYAWHDGTEPLRWSEGKTHKMSLLELSLVPGEILIFETLESAAAAFFGWPELAEYHEHLSEAVNRYFPILWDGSDTWFCLDLMPGKDNRVIFCDLQNDKPFCHAYECFEEFIVDLLRVNKTGERLRFFG